MTCVLAIAEKGNIWMGADSAAVAGLSMRLRKDPKIYQVGEMLIGFTSSFRMGQLLGHSLRPLPQPRDIPIAKYMATIFIDNVRETLKHGGYTTINNNIETGGQFLVGYRGRIFTVDNDFQVGECNKPFDAVGCGCDLALGALYATVGMEPVKRIRTALQAAESFSAGVRRPWIIAKTNGRR